MARLPILMYHSVAKDHENSKGLTISVARLEEQFDWLKSQGFTSLHFSELNKFTKDNFPKKAVIITFDDVYVNQFELAYPLLKKYNLKASFFAPFGYINAFDSWNDSKNSIMNIDQLNSLDSSIVEIGLHSFDHIAYDKAPLKTIDDDFKSCKSFIEKHNLPIRNILAYPYGKYPKKEPQRSVFFNLLKEQDIAFGLRIGNRVNTFPFKNNYEVKRIDIKGEDTLGRFKLKLRFGKLKLF